MPFLKYIFLSCRTFSSGKEKKGKQKMIKLLKSHVLISYNQFLHIDFRITGCFVFSFFFNVGQ